MELLQIEAELEFYRPLPYFDAIKTIQTVDVYLNGGDPLEDTLQELERFRQALNKLITEALTQTQSGSDIEPPYVRVRLKAGEDAEKPTLDYGVSLHAIEKETPEYLWSLRWGAQDESTCDCFVTSPTEGAKTMHAIIERITAKWFALIQFQKYSVERRPESQDE